DVPFFLTGGAALGTGRGDKITTWLDGFEMPVILVKPPEGLSTPDVYRSGKALITPGEKSRAFQGILREKNLQKIAESLFNGLEPAALFLMPEIGEIKKKLLEAGALGTLVSGSGPTVFAVAQNQEKAEQIACKLEGEGWTVFVTRTITTGVERI
ncbi:MAG TPA: 4-(cytidine 5'-diphospho)-2-C-methyl-D-erythritol kinase, partial [bacterium]